MMIQRPSLQTDSIGEQVYLSLKKQILEGQLQPGARLLVMDIAGTFQISQGPVREALERLKQEGLIISKPNKGSVVSDITSKEIKDIFVMREIIEGFAVKESVPLLDPADFEYLEHTIAEMDNATRRNDMMHILGLDLEFHGFFYKRCGNHVALDMWKQMSTKVMRFMAMRISIHYLTNDKLVEEHFDLIRVLKQGDPLAAEQRFIQHMKAYKMIQIT
ncbi:GntR family transcriptional regulator [Paenibacillus piri]|uniref:GntR family transcriptional regulator n=2 Tax=Paenibacillus piri TaxID=2547395 RepID=A0A4R5KBP2_9BACL|nr:GntR family transcriptional regulator [Paenibacillus piri]